MNAQPGSLLGGRYRLEKRLDGGGRTETWLARDGALATNVVVKRLPLGGGADGKTIELLEREARVLANLRHPAIPCFVELVREIDALCLVQGFIPGQSLDEVLAARGPLPALEAASIGIEVASVLEHIHGLSPPIIHRDLKPANLVRGEPSVNGKQGAIHVIDFGAVRDILRPAREAPEGDSFAGGDTIVGTYGYMPAEQFAGQAVPASDVYALGATLAHLLIGRAPISLPLKGGRLDLALDPRVPAGLSRILERATEPELSRRTANATQLREELEAFRADHELPQPSVERRRPTGGWPKFRLPLFLLLVASALARGLS